MLGAALRSWTSSCPRFRGLNVDALREDLQRVLGELRESRAGTPRGARALAPAPPAGPAGVKRRRAPRRLRPRRHARRLQPRPRRRRQRARCARSRPARRRLAARRRALVHRRRGARPGRAQPRRSAGLTQPVGGGAARLPRGATRARLLDATRLYPGVRGGARRASAAAPLAVLTNKPGDMSRAHPRRASASAAASSRDLRRAATCPRASPTRRACAR